MEIHIEVPGKRPFLFSYRHRYTFGPGLADNDNRVRPDSDISINSLIIILPVPFAITALNTIIPLLTRPSSSPMSPLLGCMRLKRLCDEPLPPRCGPSAATVTSLTM